MQLNNPSEIPQHIAIIMDGNGRWAKKRLLPRSFGHQQGVKTVKTITAECRKLGVRYLTLYAFSSENWQRPETEVGFLMDLFQKFLRSELKELISNDVRLRVMGDKSRLPSEVLKAINEAEENSKNCKSLDLILAVSYGSRAEIVSACKNICQNVINSNLKLDELNEDVFSKHLFLPEVPAPDLLIRTSNEQRISNFMLWQLAYAEFIFTDVLWPDFGEQDFKACLEEYARRERRFGCTSEQVGISK